MAEGDAELQDLYRDVLLDYFRNSARKGTIDGADVHSHGVNPVCGDEIEISASLSGDGGRNEKRLAKLRYSGHGCVISQASSAMLAEALEGLSVEEARSLARAFKSMMLRETAAASLPERLGEARAFEGVRKYPMRVKCATLAWNTLIEGLKPPANGAAAAEFSEE